ncbi:hypothetical protein Q5424_20855 [Conexibacter sp. JD483]|uniref:hypothetical protein n=1 Tax=unclassified Conexibacter TaxID=2627773 RepID=UPI002720B55A|nr:MULTISPECIES: hypothetical protein [unclassified Conexibacter]MDO8185022.1 hypothetical protein [Conexibacter sp. CPCC 205706]MDO8198166.1 hypothetical protein [Conexibacter sp. CPCC 205762]MDR9371562.1 hypothetical protein [Conexibacter sp. JD483]
MRVPRRRTSAAPLRELALGLLAAVSLGAVAAAPAAAESSWRLEQPAPPAGSPYKVPLGRPGDLSCWSATRCLLAIEGNAVVARGLYSYDGVEWRQLSTVCGGPADTTRIAWASATEFWVVTTPSLPRSGGGLGLCRFRDGQVIASYSTAPESPDPFRAMTAAACNGPNDCWFAGVGAQDPSGQRVGAYHLRWNGETLTSTYAPQGRGVSDLIFADGRYWETTYVGIQREDRTSRVTLAEEEAFPYLIHTIDGAGFHNELFGGGARVGVPLDGTELLAADAAGGAPWFVGGGASSGPSAPEEGIVPRPPLAARKDGNWYSSVQIDESQFGDQDRFTDVAALPGGGSAWVAVQAFRDRVSTTARARVALLQADGTTSVQRLPAGGAGRGSAARIEFTSADEGWMITNAGWLFHFTDGHAHARDTSPAFSTVIGYRPNEAIAQSIPDLPPVDDSQLFAPPAVEPEPEPGPPVTRTQRIPALMTKISRPRVDKRLRLHLSFTLRRKARVQLQAYHKRKLAARTKLRVLRPGRHTLVLQLSRKKWPDRLRFRTIESRAR